MNEKLQYEKVVYQKISAQISDLAWEKNYYKDISEKYAS